MQADILGRQISLNCDWLCTECKPVEYERYEKMTSAERDNEAMKGICRNQKKITAHLYK